MSFSTFKECTVANKAETIKIGTYNRAEYQVPDGSIFIPLGLSALGFTGSCFNSFLDKILEKLYIDQRTFLMLLLKKEIFEQVAFKCGKCGGGKSFLGNIT